MNNKKQNSINNKYNIKNSLYKVIDLDYIRILKFVEFIQYAIIFILLSIFFAYIWKKIYFKINDNEKHNNEKHNNEKHHNRPHKKKKLFIHILNLIFQTIMIIIITFYIKKIGLLFPSISGLLNKNFIPLTTLEYSMHVAIFIVLIELLPTYKILIEEIHEELK